MQRTYCSKMGSLKKFNFSPMRGEGLRMRLKGGRGGEVVVRHVDKL